jgi:hypothetical protein
MTELSKTQLVYEHLIRKYFNKTGQILYEGDVVCIDKSNNDDEYLHVILPENASDENIAGVVLETARVDEPVFCIQFGKGIVKVDASGGDIAAGDRLVTKGGGNNTIAVKGAATNGAIAAVALEAYTAGVHGGDAGTIDANIISPVGYGVGEILGSIATTGYVDQKIGDIFWKPPVMFLVNYIKAGAPSGTAAKSGEYALDETNAKIYKFTTSWNEVYSFIGAAREDLAERVLFAYSGTDTSGDSGTYTRDKTIRQYFSSSFTTISPQDMWTVLNKDDEEIYSYNSDDSEWVVVATRKRITVETITYESIESTEVDDPTAGNFVSYLKKETVGLETQYSMVMRDENGDEIILFSYIS